MPKVRWGFDTSAEPEEPAGFVDYEGPVPPTGVYSCVLKRLGIKTNCNGDDMLNGLLEIREPAGSDKAQFNGYGFWFNQNLTPQGLPYFKPFLINGLGVTWKDFVDKTICESEERPTQIVRIGRVEIQDREIPMKVQAKHTDSEQYGEKLENPRFLPKNAGGAAAATKTWDSSEKKEDSESAGDDEAPF